jgi:hypothetical protein
LEKAGFDFWGLPSQSRCTGQARLSSKCNTKKHLSRATPVPRSETEGVRPEPRWFGKGRALALRSEAATGEGGRLGRVAPPEQPLCRCGDISPFRGDKGLET